MKNYFAVSCCYFKTIYETSVQLEAYIRDFDATGHVLTDCMYIIIKFLLAIIFCHYDCLCGTLPPANFLRSIPCFMAPLNYLLHDAVYKFPCYDTEKTPHLAGIPPNISLLYSVLYIIVQYRSVQYPYVQY